MKKCFDKESYNMLLQEIAKLSGEYSFDDSFKSRLKELNHNIENFSIKAVLIGTFNAGKSAFLNTLLEIELLEEEQSPMTAIATELIYGDVEKIECFKLDGTIDITSFELVNKINSDEYSHLVYHITNNFLKNNTEYTLVDMPGTNSGIEKHNKAIMQYIEQSSIYLVVIDTENGTIHEDTRRFLNEIKQYHGEIGIILTKTDKKPPQEIEAILESVGNQANHLFSKDIGVMLTSKYDNELTIKFTDFMKQFENQRIFENKFRNELSTLANIGIHGIDKIITSLEIDDSELDKEIEARNNVIKSLEDQLKKESLKFSDNLENVVKPSIIKDVENVLYSNISLLARKIIDGNNAFATTVNGLLRPVLISSTKKYTEESFSEFLSEIDFSNIFIVRDIDKSADDLTNKIKSTYSILDKIHGKSNESGKATYKAVTAALAITTSAVAPWLELIIVFLPEILKLFNFWGENSRNEEIKNTLEYEIIPNIVLKMSPAIDESLNEMKLAMMDELTQNIEDLLKVENEAILEAMKMKEKNKGDFDSLVESLEEEKQKLEKMMVEIF